MANKSHQSELKKNLEVIGNLSNIQGINDIYVIDPFIWVKPFLTSDMDLFYTKTISEYDQELPQSQTADKPMAS